MILLYMVMVAGGPAGILPLWFIAVSLAMSPLPAAIFAGCALSVRQRWRLFVTLASLCLCGHTVTVTAVVAICDVLGELPNDEGTLLVALAVAVPCILSFVFSGSAAAFVTYRRSWYLPWTPAWHGIWLRLAPKILFLWLVGLALVLWAVQSIMDSARGGK